MSVIICICSLFNAARKKYHICQVPGCGSSVARLWNHIYQTHKKLPDEEKKMYLQLSRAQGPQEEIQIVPIPPKKEEDKTPEKKHSEIDASRVPITSIGRQKYGDTRDMKMYPLEEADLTAFMQ